MNDMEMLARETAVLFGRDYLKELTGETDVSDEDDEAFFERAQSLIREFGWPAVFECWSQYLRANCRSAESVLNFANLFWAYEGHRHFIHEPYEFLAWFYVFAADEGVQHEATTIMDSVSIEVLSRAGVRGVGWEENPNYIPEEDPKMLAMIEDYRNKLL